MSVKEKVFILVAGAVAAGSLFVWLAFLYLGFTKTVPVKGGEYTEGIVGQPMYVNPLFSSASSVDADIEQLIYSRLFKYDGQGKIINDLAENYEISDDGKVYTVWIRQDAKWHDGENVTAGDVYFTVKLIQDPAYKSPLRFSLQGVTVSQKDDYSLEFFLENPYAGFLSNLTFGILPRHIWEKVPAEKFSLSELNLQPIGSGPYYFSEFQKDSEGNILSFKLRSFQDYYQGEAYISRLDFSFYSDTEGLINAFNGKKIMGMGGISPEKLDGAKIPEKINVYPVNISHFFAVYFNQTKSVPLANEDVRSALSYALDRDEIIQEVLKGKGSSVFSPFSLRMPQCDEDVEIQHFDLEKAKKILDDSGWKISEEKNIRMKGDEELKFELATIDSPLLSHAADIVKKQWLKAGAEVEVKVLNVSDLQQNYVRPREYQALLFGQAVDSVYGLYSFLHSSQKKDPGLNLAMFDSKEADELLEEMRTVDDQAEIEKKCKELQRIINKEVPAAYVFSPYYLHLADKKIKGISVSNIIAPQWRFAEVYKWYVKTKRVKK